MSDISINKTSFFNSELLALFPTKDDSIKGIFAFLRFLDGTYKSRYKIEGDLQYGKVEYIVQAHETEHYLITTTENKPEISFLFDDYFIATNYSMQNGYEPKSPHSFMSSWNLIGVDDSNIEHIIDSHKNFKLCGNSQYCDLNYTKTFQIKKPAKFKKYILRSLENSVGFKYLIIRYFDFYGVLCSNNSNVCYFPHYRKTCIQKQRLNIVISYTLFSIVI